MGLLHHPFRLQLVLAHFGHRFQFLNYFVWSRITIEDSVSAMRTWSILSIKSELKWCKQLGRSLISYFNQLVSGTDGGQEGPRGHMSQSSTVYLGWFVAFWEQQFFPCLKFTMSLLDFSPRIPLGTFSILLKIEWNINFVGLLHHPFWLQLVLAHFWLCFSTF